MIGKLSAQNAMVKRDGHFIAHLDFMGNYPLKNTEGRVTSSLDYGNGLTNTDQKKYTEKGITVYGLVKSAVLKVDWWALFGEPTEQYQFEWISSGYYDITFDNGKGKIVSAKINKGDLTKYPDLLKRFNNLAPTEMEFEIFWNMGKPNDVDLKKFKEKYNPDEKFFYSGMVKNDLSIDRGYKTIVKSGGLLFEPSGITPFATPGIRPGKGEEFLGMEKGQYNDADVKRILYWWQFCQTHNIYSFKVTKQNWPIDEMKFIAEKYLAYEKGEEEPTPKQLIAQAEEKNKNTQAYTKNDFWGDAVEEENGVLNDFFENNKRGLKNDKGRIIIPAKYYNIKYSSEMKYNIIALNENSITIFNRKGKELYNINKEPKTKVDVLFSEDGYLYTEEAGGNNLANAKITVYNISNFQKLFEDVGAWSSLNKKGIGKRGGKIGAFFQHQKWENNYRMYYYYEIKDTTLELYRKIGYPGKTEAHKHETFLDNH
ncbi:hypothetical protein [Pedobacter nanyangensis]|uniref:hypothetical protein n=1 Tax=Pedobacter nanyangensis TaxID=1562389 RepID=UPI000DE3FC3D|nr:hypothetical protein [Pedobacter nanyangensis]